MRQIKQFFKLILNELYKSFFQKKTIAFLCLLILLTGLFAYFTEKEETKGDWRKDIKTEIVMNQKVLEEAKSAEVPDQQVISSLENRAIELDYRLEHNMPTNVTSPLEFVANSCMDISVFIVFFMAAFSADVMASEFSSGTIRQILVKPVKRWKLYLAKFCSTLIVSLVMFLFLLLVTTIAGFIVFGGTEQSIYNVQVVEGEIVKFNMMSNLFWTLVFQLFALAVVSTITFFIATLTRKSSLAIIISFIIFFGGAILGEFFMEYGFYKYIITPNLTLNAYLPGGWSPFEGSSFGFSLSVCLTYAAVFLTGGMLVFSRRDVY